MNITVTTFQNVFSKLARQARLLEELGKIRDGHWKGLIERCRHQLRMQKNDEYKKTKLTLPATSFCASFEGGHKIDNLVEYNSLLVIDIDKIQEELVPELKSRLGSDIYIYALWLSPSGQGLKGLIRLASSVELHKLAFDQVADYFF